MPKPVLKFGKNVMLPFTNSALRVLIMFKYVIVYHCSMFYDSVHLFILCSLENRPHVICVDAGGILSGHWFPPYVLCTDVPLLLAHISCERALIYLFQ